MHVWYDAFYVGSLKPPACTTNRPLCQVTPYQKGAKRKSSIQRKAMMTPHLPNPPAILEKWLHHKKKKQVIHVIPVFLSFPTQYFLPFFLRHFPGGCRVSTFLWPSRPRRLPVRAGWIQGARAAASGGNPSPTFEVDLRWKRQGGESWMSRWKLGSMVRINGLFHLLINGVFCWAYNPPILTI